MGVKCIAAMLKGQRAPRLAQGGMERGGCAKACRVTACAPRIYCGVRAPASVRAAFRLPSMVA